MRRRRGNRSKPEVVKAPEVRANSEITAEKVRLIDEDGEMMDVLPLADALAIAEEREIDLVEISPKANPPVCKLVDHGKYLFNLKKKRLEGKKKQQQIVHKTIKFRPNTDIGDYEIKMARAREFLAKGNHVKMAMWFRGREIAHQDVGERLLRQIQTDLEDVATTDDTIELEGRQITLTFSPIKRGK